MNNSDHTNNNENNDRDNNNSIDEEHICDAGDTDLYEGVRIYEYDNLAYYILNDVDAVYLQLANNNNNIDNTMQDKDFIFHYSSRDV